MTDFITCVITTYKRPLSTLKRAVESVVKQTHQNIELIVVNDAPEEEELSEDINSLLNDYRKIKITYLIHEKNMGACKARNTAISKAQGKYIAFLDDDDEWLPEKLEKQYNKIKNTNIALVYCSHYEIYRDDVPILVTEELARTGLHEDEFDRLLRANFIGSTSYPLIDLEALKEVGGFNIDLRASQDYDLWLRIAKNHQITYCNEPLVNYYFSEVSISTNSNNIRQGIEFLLVSHADYYETHKETYNYRLNYIAYVWFKRKEYKTFLEYLHKAISIKPFSRHNFLIISKIMKSIPRKISLVKKLVLLQ